MTDEHLFSRRGIYAENTSNHYRCSVKKSVLKNFTIFTEKHLCLSLGLQLY